MENLGIAVGIIAGLLVILQALAPGYRWCYRRLRRLSGDSGGEDTAVRARRWWFPKAPLLDKCAPNSGAVAGRIAAAVRSGLPVPASLRKVKHPVDRAWRYARRALATNSTSRKPLFKIEAWEYVPVAQLDSSVVFEHSDGFALIVKLAEGELTRHLKYSAATPSGSGITVVVAPLESLEDEQVPVCSFRVSSVGWRIDNRSKRSVMLFSERQEIPEEPGAASDVAQSQVPSGALWLVCDHGVLSLPEGWESSGTGLQTSNGPGTRPSEAMAKTVKKQVKREVIAKVALWALATFGGPLVFLVLSIGSSERWREQVTTIASSWATFFVLIGAVFLLRALREWARGCFWRCQQGVEADSWTGRTTWALAAGRMTRGVTILADRAEQDLWDSTWPQDSPVEEPAPDDHQEDTP